MLLLRKKLQQHSLVNQHKQFSPHLRYLLLHNTHINFSNLMLQILELAATAGIEAVESGVLAAGEPPENYVHYVREHAAELRLMTLPTKGST